MPIKSLMTGFLGAVITVISAIASPAADISVEPKTPGGPTRIFINGSINLDDADQFIQKADVSNAIVFFNSEGGDLLAGFVIGQTIREKKFATAVKRGDLCASACGLAWLGGGQRFLEPGAQIGFRAALDSAELGNAVLGGYLKEIGLSVLAIAYITEARPQGMKWLDHAQAAKLGIVISAWPSAATVPQAAEVSSGSLWDYNGSTLLLVHDGMQRKFYYETPRPELVKIGVQRGTLFFVGRQQGRAYRGIALVFSKQCKATPYSVRGEISQDNQTIVMRGNAPSLDAKCRIIATYEATAMLVNSGEQPSDPVSSISPPP